MKHLHNLQGYGHGRRRRGAGGVKVTFKKPEFMKHLRNLNLINVMTNSKISPNIIRSHNCNPKFSTSI